MKIVFQIRLAQYVPGALQAYAADQLVTFAQCEPGFIEQGNDSLHDQFETALDLFLIKTGNHLERIFGDDGWQLDREFAAQNWPFEPCCQQTESSPDVIDMHMSSD